MLALFTIGMDVKTGEVTFSGNMPVQQALNVIQQILITKAAEELAKKQAEKPTEVKDAPNPTP